MLVACSYLTNSLFTHHTHLQRALYATKSGKTGLIAYLKVMRNAGFKYLVCCMQLANGQSCVYQIFTRFIPIPYVPEHLLCK